MYTVVVADDEAELRRSLIARTPWAQCGFEVVGEAANGMEALELVERLCPDLLLTDIRMPFLSGIALARAVREIRPAMHIAFLSGFDDFTYAQQAIEYNIISYMLKPISSEELAGELRAIRGKIDSRFHEIADERTGHPPVSEFVIPLLLGAHPAADGDTLETTLFTGALSCGLLPQDASGLSFVVLATTITDDTGKDCTGRAQVHAVELVLQKYLRAHSCFFGGRIVSLLCAPARDMNKYLHIAVSEITQSIERVLGKTCAVGISRAVGALTACHAAYQEAIGALDYPSGDSAGDARYITDLERAGAVHTDFTEAAVQLEALIKSGTKETIEAFLRELFGGLHGALETDLMMVQLLAAVCRSVGAVLDSDTAGALFALSPLGNLTPRPLDELQNKLTAFCLRANEAISSQCRESGAVLCEQALAIIRTQYADETLSLASISEALHISPNYLSALIRKTAGDTFINLLTAKRLETARELLQCTSLKVMEIAAKCGYADQHYFSYCFKKSFGVSPLAMRRQSGGEGGAPA